MSESSTADALRLLRDAAPQVLGAVARRAGDLLAAEDAVQEALIAASEQWPRVGVPTNPRGWLYQVALRRLADAARRESARRRREEAVADEALHAQPFVPPPDADIGAEQDDTLVLLFMCCHPSLSPASAIALTLRAVGGLTTAEIARAFLVPEATMAQRISRAKQSIRASGVAFEMPGTAEQAERLASVLRVLYLIFNEGYASTSGDAVHRVDLSDEAIRLGRMLHAVRPDEPEITGLLALMLLTDARRAARTGEIGELIPLDEQDRSRWNSAMIAEGRALLASMPAGAGAGYYALQAAVAAEHDRAPTVDETDWQAIRTLYQSMMRLTDNPVVALNYAVAVAMIDGPAAGLALLAPLDDDRRIAGHFRLDAVRGHLYARAGDRARAIAHLRAAADATTSLAERHHLITKIARLRNA